MGKASVNLQSVHNKTVLCSIAENYKHGNLSGRLNILLIKHCLLLFGNEYRLVHCTLKSYYFQVCKFCLVH